MSSAIKRQRTDELNMMTGAASREHMGAVGLKRGGRGGESAVGGTLRLNVWSCLKPTEAEILGMMLEAVKLSKSGTVVRVAGGWVRDKLLGLEVRAVRIFLPCATARFLYCCLSTLEPICLRRLRVNDVLYWPPSNSSISLTLCPTPCPAGGIRQVLSCLKSLVERCNVQCSVCIPAKDRTQTRDWCQVLLEVKCILSSSRVPKTLHTDICARRASWKRAGRFSRFAPAPNIASP